MEEKNLGVTVGRVNHCFVWEEKKRFGTMTTGDKSQMTSEDAIHGIVKWK